MSEFKERRPNVSVIIPCYNHGRFLSQAIESVIDQSYPEKEIIVVDDGSTDNTKKVALSYPGVHYIYQTNQGLSAARNTGITSSTGEFLTFLDADDWLYENALSVNVKFLTENPDWAFVSGDHDKVDEWGAFIEDEVRAFPTEKHYEELLKGNYIGMHSAVMYARWALHDERFDTSLRACEDYDLYLRLARQYEVGCHNVKLTAYRHHSSNMSKNIPWMLRNVLEVHERQRKHLKSSQERVAFALGRKIWKEYYSSQLFANLWKEIDRTPDWPSADSLAVMVKEKPRKLFPYFVKKTRVESFRWLKNTLPDSALRYLSRGGFYKQFAPSQGKIDHGDFNRVTPFSSDFGFDRGGPIDRYYIERFLSEQKQYVKGAVLEIGDNEYTLKFGKHAVAASEILHVDESNQKATIVGDIADLPHVPSSSFDCIILTQTLHLIYDFKAALQTCFRILKPGGALLLTVPGISPIDKGAWKEYWLWSFTKASVNRLMSETFGPDSTVVQSYGNVHVAASFLYGVGLPEVEKEKLDVHDESYPVIIAAKAIKAEYVA